MIWTLRIECVTGRFLEGEWVRIQPSMAGSNTADFEIRIW